MILCFGATASIVLIFFVINVGSVPLTCAALFVLGVNVIPIIGVSYSLACELVYPIGEGVTCGILMMIASLISTIYTFAVTTLLEVEKGGKLDGKWLAIYMLFASTTLSIIFGFFVQVDLSSEVLDNLEVKSTGFSIGIAHKQETEEEMDAYFVGKGSESPSKRLT